MALILERPRRRGGVGPGSGCKRFQVAAASHSLLVAVLAHALLRARIAACEHVATRAFEPGLEMLGVRELAAEARVGARLYVAVAAANPQELYAPQNSTYKVWSGDNGSGQQTTVRLFNGTMQCPTCHNPHMASGIGLAYSSTYGKLCVTCHKK